MKMKKFRVTFTVDGKRSEEYVSATGGTEARKIVEKKFSNSKVAIINVQDTTTGFYCWYT